MRLVLETGNIKWGTVRFALALLLVGAAIGGLVVLMAPTQVNCRLQLPDSFQIPSMT